MDQIGAFALPIHFTRDRLTLGASAAAAALGLFTTPYMGLATFAYLCMVIAIVYRRGHRERHRRLMFLAMGIDVSLVLALELLRGATATAVGGELGPWQLAHVICSSLAVTLYVPMIYAGVRLWEEETPGKRALHRRLGLLTFLFRSLGFILMFSLLGRSD